MLRYFAFGLFAVLVSVQAPAQTILYLNFDEAADATFADHDPYTLGSTEIAAGEDPSVWIGTLTLEFRNNAGDGPSIGAPPGGLAGTPQGGKALLVDGNGTDEGLHVLAEGGLLSQDITMEAIWYTDSADGSGNTAGIQSVCGNEWPFGQRSEFFIRTVNLGTARMDWWTDRGDSDGENVQIDPNGYAVDTWYHDVLVYDYNEGDPANSTITAYRDGSLVGSSPYNAGGALTSLFGQNSEYPTQFYGFAVGFANSLDANWSDHRGLSGAIDAVAVSLGALTPAEFVLPTGTVSTTFPPSPEIEPVHEGRVAARLQWINQWAPGMDVGLDRQENMFTATEGLVPGNEIQVEAWARNGRYGVSRLQMRFAAFSGSTWLGDSSSSWFVLQPWYEPYTYNYVVPATATQINLGMRTESVGASFVADDLSLIDVTAAGAPLDFSNASFEDWPGDTPTDWRFFAVSGADAILERIFEDRPVTNVDSRWELYR